jgi:probable addiction module antidote protein
MICRRCSALQWAAELAENDPPTLAAALGAVARARGMTQLATATGISREALYRALSAEGNPSLDTLLKVLGGLGLRLDVRPTAAEGELFRNGCLQLWPVTEPLLEAYCKGESIARTVSQQIEAFKPEWLTTGDGIERFKTLTGMYQRQCSVLAGLATKMRISQQSRYDAKRAATAAAAAAAAAAAGYKYVI